MQVKPHNGSDWLWSLIQSVCVRRNVSKSIRRPPLEQFSKGKSGIVVDHGDTGAQLRIHEIAAVKTGKAVGAGLILVVGAQIHLRIL